MDLAAPQSLMTTARMGIRSAASAVWKRLKRYAGFLSALALFCLLQLPGTPIIHQFDEWMSSIRFGLAQTDTSGHLVVVEIDSESLRAENSWPWPRERYARAINNLRDAGADLIAFDIDFSAASSPAGDEALRKAVDAVPASVILPTFMQADANNENAPSKTVSETSIFGNANVEIGKDGQVHHYRNGYNQANGYRPTIAALLAAQPYGDTSSFHIDYGTRVDHIERLSFDDIYEGRFDPAKIAGRHVLIGATALELGDTFPSPIGAATPGVLIHALAYENIVSGRMMLELNDSATMALGILALIVFWPRREKIELSRFFSKHAAVALVVLVSPVVLQSFVPVSLELASVLLSQVLCIAGGLRRELDRRAVEIVRQREDHLSHIAMHDPETGLPNRRAMVDRANAFLAAEDGETVNMLVAGIDQFTTLRAAIGFAHTSEAIVQFCHDLEATIPGVEAYRLSSTLIGLLFTPNGTSHGAGWVRSGLTDIDSIASVAGQAIELKVRTGAATSRFEGATAEQMIEHASIALDYARQNDLPHQSYDDMETVDPRMKLAMVTGVGRGIELGEFELMYQPKVVAADHSIKGCEALLRWRHSDFGLIRPDHFIPVAEQTGAIERLTLWVVDRAISDQSMARAQDIELPISVNVSARLLSNPQFCGTLVRKISQAKANICVEITETAVIKDEAIAIQSIAAFREAGIQVSIDDFGAGLSSLMYLKQFNADELKLDKALLSDLVDSERDQAIIHSTIALAHELGMTVVAEGIEDITMARLLRDLGCDLLQGYHFSRPVPIDALLMSVATARDTERRLQVA